MSNDISRKKDLKTTSINTLMLYILTFAKMVFPLVTLPYLTRVLSTDMYGMVAYVKAVMGYSQIIIEFGFLLSAVKNIVENVESKKTVNVIVSNTILAKIILSIISFIVVLCMLFLVPALQGNALYTIIAFLTPFLSCFLADYFFRGIEKMHFITVIYVVMKSISTLLTVLMVKSDSNVLLIPVFDALSSIIAVAISWIIIYKLGYRLVKASLREALLAIKESFTYFLNSVASTAFGALLTIIIGIIIPNFTEVAYWSVCSQLVGAVQSLYTPISNGVYPYMIRKKDLTLIRNILYIFMPIVFGGCVICYILSPWILRIMGGSEYIAAVPVFRILISVLFISFPVAILGWPVLGPIEKTKEMTFSTVVGAIIQFLIVFVLYAISKLTLVMVAFSRSISELVMLLIRFFFLIKYKSNYNK